MDLGQVGIWTRELDLLPTPQAQAIAGDLEAWGWPTLWLPEAGDRDAVKAVPKDGFTVVLAGEAFGKVRASAICAGIGRAAIDEAANYALVREHRGEPIGERFPTIRALLGNASAGVFGAAACVGECARMLDANRDVTSAAAAARLVSARAAKEAALAALHVCGAYGLTRDLPVGRLYREAVFFDVAQGVAELQQLIVARELLKRVRHTTHGTGVQR